MTTMTSSKPVRRSARRRGELHRDDAWIHGLSRRPIRDGEVHALAIRRLEAAVDDRRRLSEQDDAVRGTAGERDAVVALAAASEQLAAREAWVKYIEHGY
jgi:hypothetical protein